MILLPYFCVLAAFVLGVMIGYEAGANSEKKRP